MEIKFSRHARRRARLYEISKTTITDILANMNLHAGEHEIIKHVPGLQYPVKMLVSVEEDLITVITNYPLKKGRKK